MPKNNLNDKNILRINQYLKKHGHEKIFSIYLEDYNKTNLYIRFDYVKKQSIYKITWFDLDLINHKKLSNYQNIQLVSKKISTNIINSLSKIKYSEEIISNEDIIGDRVYMSIKRYKTDLSFGFTRFLPKEWENFINPIVLVFSYLPRSMDILLNEIFAIFDGTSDIFTYSKPIKFDLLHSNPNSIFKINNINIGTKYYADSRVLFLEKIDNKYYAIVEDREPHLIILNQIDETHSIMWCNCKQGYLCSHIYAALLALRHQSFNNFYKVKYTGPDIPLLEKLMYSNVYLCYGISNDKIMLISAYGEIITSDITKKGKLLFEVIEDDDECSLSKILKEYQK